MKPSDRKRIVGVIGDGDPNTPHRRLAYQVGQLLAKQGAVLVCGGLYGVMESACQGAKEVGGLTVGILPGDDRRAANPYVDVALPTAFDQGRNFLVVKGSEGIIAIGGGFGTLSELGLALKLGVPIVGLKTWKLPATEGKLYEAEDAEEAVELLFAVIRGGKPGA